MTANVVLSVIEKKQMILYDRMPVEGSITGGFGDDYTIGGVTYQHRGIDFSAIIGTPVVSPCLELSRVAHVDSVGAGGFGMNVRIELANGHFMVVAHLSHVDVAIDEWVTSGQQLGLSGNTGVSTGPHVHWQQCETMWMPTDIAKSRDPMEYMKTEGELGEIAALKTQFDQLNEAVMKRFDIINIASGDYQKMLKAHTALKDEGLL